MVTDFKIFSKTGLRKSFTCIYLFVCLFIYLFLVLHQLHMEVPGLGAESELQLLAYTTATAIWDLSHFCNLHHSLLQHRILNPLSEARDQTLILMYT